jgi:hypothetical protein
MYNVLTWKLVLCQPGLFEAGQIPEDLRPRQLGLVVIEVVQVLNSLCNKQYSTVQYVSEK